jgi:hypothetical protein
MKYSSYLKTSLAVLALASAQSSSGAVVLAGFYDFFPDKLTQANNPANQLYTPPAGLSAWAESNMSAQGQGGDMLGTYGNSSFTVPIAPIGDGHAAIKMFGTTSSFVRFVLTNNTGYDVVLEDFFFDAAATTGQFDRKIQLDFTNVLGQSSLVGTFPSTGPLTPTSPQNFDDFGVGMGPGGYTIGDTQSVSFLFTIPANSANGTVLWVDNVAFVGYIVPEPSSLMAFGCMLMTGLTFRRRKG